MEGGGGGGQHYLQFSGLGGPQPIKQGISFSCEKSVLRYFQPVVFSFLRYMTKEDHEILYMLGIAITVIIK